MIASGPKVEELIVNHKVHRVCSVTYILIVFFFMILFRKQKEFNTKIIFVPIFEYDFRCYVLNNIKFHFWINAYFVKELHLICKCLWACPNLKSLPQRFENETFILLKCF